MCKYHPADAGPTFADFDDCEYRPQPPVKPAATYVHSSGRPLTTR